MKGLGAFSELAPFMELLREAQGWTSGQCGSVSFDFIVGSPGVSYINSISVTLRPDAGTLQLRRSHSKRRRA